MNFSLFSKDPEAQSVALEKIRRLIGLRNVRRRLVLNVITGDIRRDMLLDLQQMPEVEHVEVDTQRFVS